jgi:energy-coupling factor transport system ATP-binding protein
LPDRSRAGETIVNALELRELSYRFPDSALDVLRNVSWSALEGSVNLVVGPSGSGKTTLLNCLNGIIPHFHGGHFGGEAFLFRSSTRMRAPRDLAASVGTVFQDPESQFVTDSVEDEIVFGMENLGYDRPTMRMRLEEVLDLLGIQHLRGRTISQLSGGERQRVALAAALATRPALLLLDEPTSQLDPLAAHDILSAVERLNRDFGTTVVIAEHRLDRVLPFTEQILSVRNAGLTPGTVQEMLATLDDVPPLIAYGRHHRWDPLPLSIRDALRHMQPLGDPPRTSRQRPASGNRLLRVEGVGHQYGSQRSLVGVSIDGYAGDAIALIGKNGSGKTTLLRLIMGLLRPSEGRILLASENTERLKVQEIARHAGYVPQFPTAILHQESVREEVEFTGRALGVAVDAEAIAAKLGIAALIDRHPLDLSGGERQRAALAAIAAAAPDILLLDEPTRGLPGRDKERLAEFIRDYAAQGKLVIVATHDVEFLVQCATRAVMLADGEIMADGDPADILAGSLTFSTQMNRLLGGKVLTLSDAGVENPDRNA